MSGPMRIFTSLVVIAILALALGVWFVRGPGPLDFAGGTKISVAAYRAGRPTGVPDSLEQASLAERGEWLAKAADCMVCHTRPGGTDYSGGLAFRLPFGTLYSTNITPDKDTGIGNYSDAEFIAAVRQGIRRDGARQQPELERIAGQLPGMKRRRGLIAAQVAAEEQKGLVDRRANAGFVAVDVLNQKSGTAMLRKLGVVNTPVVLVVKRPAKVESEFHGLVDRAVVAQAVTQAR